MSERTGRTPAPGGITCRDLAARLSEYLDGSLDSGLVAHVERHLEVCEDCSRCAGEIRATIRLIRERGRIRITAEEKQRLRERLWAKLQSVGD